MEASPQMAGLFSWRHMEPLDWVLLLCVGASVLCILAFVTMVFVGRYRIPRKDLGAGAAREDQTDLIAFRIAAPCVSCEARPAQPAPSTAPRSARSRLIVLMPQLLRQPPGQGIDRDPVAELAPRRPALLGQHHGIFAFGVAPAFKACQRGDDVQRRAVSPPPCEEGLDLLS